MALLTVHWKMGGGGQLAGLKKKKAVMVMSFLLLLQPVKNTLPMLLKSVLNLPLHPLWIHLLRAENMNYAAEQAEH